MIIETTKQDEIEEQRYRFKQETDSLNHIISKRILFQYKLN